MNKHTTPKVADELAAMDVERKVYVVAGGDFPDSAWSTEAAAEAYVQRQREEDARNQRRIYWRIYEYELDGAKA